MSASNTNLVEKLSHIQRNLSAPKSQTNKFGGYSYRNCEDILEALKPLIDGLIVTINDDIVQVGDRFYIKATARITDGKEHFECSAFARESLSRKGMDDSQLTGSTSSYARKYALNGLFLIDDNKDADSSSPEVARAPSLTEVDKQWVNACRLDPEVLNQIEDPKYKQFITQQLEIKQ